MEARQLSTEFTNAGISCHVQKAQPSLSGYQAQFELWVDNLRDCRRAMRLCVQSKIGLRERSRSQARRSLRGAPVTQSQRQPKSNSLISLREM